jgi:predicted small lipoprotein YifL
MKKVFRIASIILLIAALSGCQGKIMRGNYV